MNRSEETGVGSGEMSNQPPKPVELSESQRLLASNSDETGEPAASQSPPPVWSRYIDSRLKQFCTR